MPAKDLSCARFHCIYAEADSPPYALARDERVANHLPLTLTAGVSILPPNQIHKKDGDPYTVFTPFAADGKNGSCSQISFVNLAVVTPVPNGFGTFPDSSPSNYFRREKQLLKNGFRTF
jgi:deoxyribodipyrimidine photolyase